MILLDLKDSRPIYEQVAERLQELMMLGILEEDSQMPSVRSLAMELSINPNTIQRAYGELDQRKGQLCGKHPQAAAGKKRGDGKKNGGVG